MVPLLSMKEPTITPRLLIPLGLVPPGPAGSSTGVNTPRSSVNPWDTPLASNHSPATTPASLSAAVSVLNAGASGSLTVVKLPGGPAKATVLLLLSV